MKVKRGKVITITSSKGGIGKTVFATNLTGVFGYLKKKTLLIDLDLYAGGIGTFLNLSNTKTIYNLVDDITNNRFKDVRDYVSKYDEYIDVMASPKDPRQGAKIDVNMIERIIETYKMHYDIVVVDTNHLTIPANLMALDLSDDILYLVSNDPIDLANTKSMMSIFHDTGKDNVKVILNESFSKDKGYFSNFDIKSVIKHNIDYILSSSMYIKNIDKYIMEGKILTLNDNLRFNNTKDKELLLSIANRLSEVNNEEESN